MRAIDILPIDKNGAKRAAKFLHVFYDGNALDGIPGTTLSLETSDICTVHTAIEDGKLFALEHGGKIIGLISYVRLGYEKKGHVPLHLFTIDPDFLNEETVATALHTLVQAAKAYGYKQITFTSNDVRRLEDGGVIKPLVDKNLIKIARTTYPFGVNRLAPKLATRWLRPIHHYSLDNNAYCAGFERSYPQRAEAAFAAPAGPGFPAHARPA